MTTSTTPLTLHQYHFEPARAGSSTNTPVLLLLHGTGGNEHDLVPLAQQLFPGAPILSPRGNVSEHGAPRFFRRHAEGVFDLPDAKARTRDLASWTKAAIEHHKLSGRPVVALGFSNGANIAALLLQLNPEVLTGAILLRPMVVLDQQAAPDSLHGKHVLITSGEHDPIVPSTHPPHLASLLQTGGAEVQLHTAVHAGHNLTRSDLDVSRTWLSQFFQS